jgi:hypothetical protein
MKKLTKILLTTVPVIALGVGSVTYAALRPDSNKAPAASVHHKAATITAETPVANTSNTAPAQAEPTTTPTEPSPPTPEENRTAVLQKVTTYAASRGWSESTTYAQTSCFDRVISTNIGYSDYDALFDNAKFTLLNDYLAGKFVFDGAVCKLTYTDPQS